MNPSADLAYIQTHTQKALDGSVFRVFVTCGHCDGTVKPTHRFCPWCGRRFYTGPRQSIVPLGQR